MSENAKVCDIFKTLEILRLFQHVIVAGESGKSETATQKEPKALR